MIENRSRVARVVLAAVATAVADGLFSSVLAAGFYGSSVGRLFRGVAATVLGGAAVEGGAEMAWIGVAMHVSVAFVWSIVYAFGVSPRRTTRRLLASRCGVAKVAALYGPFVWTVMSLAVIPILVQRPPRLGLRWWVQLVGHVPFVGLPIVALVGRPQEP